MAIDGICIRPRRKREETREGVQSVLIRGGTVEPVSRNQIILGLERGQGKKRFP